MSAGLDSRLLGLKAELDDHARIARYLGLDFERPSARWATGTPRTRSRGSGRSPNGCSNSCGGITTCRAPRPGKPWRPDQRMPAVHPQPHGDRGAARHPAAAQPFRPRRLPDRRRGRHDRDPAAAGCPGVVHQHRQRRAERACPQARARGRRQGRVPGRAVRDPRLPAGQRFELSQHTVYQLFVRERGLRIEHVELLLSRDGKEVSRSWRSLAGRCCGPGCPS